MSTETLPHQLIARWIQQRPLRPSPDEAWVLHYGVPVWILIARLLLQEGDVERIAQEHGVPIEAVWAAVAYYQRHQEAVDERIARNRTDDAVPHPRPSRLTERLAHYQ